MESDTVGPHAPHLLGATSGCNLPLTLSMDKTCTLLLTKRIMSKVMGRHSPDGVTEDCNICPPRRLPFAGLDE